MNTLPIVRALHSAGFAVLERGPEESLALARSGNFELVTCLCDPGLGLELALLTSIATGEIGLIALLPQATPQLVSQCLEAGADACLELGAEEMLIVAQAHAVMRRRGGQPGSFESAGVLQVGDLTVDIDRCEVERAGEFVPLTASEYRIVEYMARNAGRVLRPHEILNAVSDEYVYLPREAQEVFKVYVRRIRRKLEPAEAEPRYLITVRGFGYRLENGANGRAAKKAAAQTA